MHVTQLSYNGSLTELQQRIYNECCENDINDQSDSTQNNDADYLPHLRKSLLLLLLFLLKFLKVQVGVINRPLAGRIVDWGK